MLSFKHWEINLINLLSIILNKNWWNITAINYVTEWLIAYTVAEATKKKITHFIHKKIFINYEVLQKILLNNNINLISAVVKHYINQLNAQHYIITFYHSIINEKMKNLNRTLNQMLTKYLINKLIKLWDEYLLQTFFVTCVQLYIIIKNNSFYLLYRIHSQIFVNNNELKKTNEIQNLKKYIK